jgi:hypothetical protein
MTIYVDDLGKAFSAGHVKSRMLSDDPVALSFMAHKIGVAATSYKGDHYVLTEQLRVAAIVHGAEPITWLQAGAMLFLYRKGLRMGDPATVDERAMALGRRS